MAQRFQATYLAGTPPWDIGRPQGAFARLIDAGEVRGRVLDVGCGTGEHAMYAAQAGHDAVGVDIAPEAIRQARAKAEQRGLDVSFVVRDVVDLNYEGEFDTALDCGMFHTLPDELRPGYARSVGRSLRREGRLFLLCFSEHEPGDWGPRRVTQAEIRSTFTEGWSVDSIEAAMLETIHLELPGASAWLASLSRTPA